MKLKHYMEKLSVEEKNIVTDYVKLKLHGQTKENKLRDKYVKLMLRNWAREIFEDKELIFSLCDCDRFEEVHLNGCKYSQLKDKHTQKIK